MFIDEEARYRLSRWLCEMEVRKSIAQNVDLVIMDSHNARIYMYEDLIRFAKKHGYDFRIIEFVASAMLIDRYRSRSIKNLPRCVYEKMVAAWEHDSRAVYINPLFDVQ